MRDNSLLRALPLRSIQPIDSALTQAIAYAG